MDSLQTIIQKRENCLREIACRTPPRNHHEVVMVDAYKRLLGDIDFRLQMAEMNAND
jgi:hypothetical protein